MRKFRIKKRKLKDFKLPDENFAYLDGLPREIKENDEITIWVKPKKNIIKRLKEITNIKIKSDTWYHLIIKINQVVEDA